MLKDGWMWTSSTRAQTSRLHKKARQHVVAWQMNFFFFFLVFVSAALVSSPKLYATLWRAHLLSITLERTCWWPHKSHVNELWERAISHNARCMPPLLFIAIIGLHFLRLRLRSDGSDDNFAQPNNQTAVIVKEGRRGEKVYIQTVH